MQRKAGAAVELIRSMEEIQINQLIWIKIRGCEPTGRRKTMGNVCVCVCDDESQSSVEYLTLSM